MLIAVLQGRVRKAYLHVVHDIDEFPSAQKRVLAGGAANAGAGLGRKSAIACVEGFRLLLVLRCGGHRSTLIILLAHGALVRFRFGVFVAKG